MKSAKSLIASLGLLILIGPGCNGEEAKKLGSACDENTVCDDLCALNLPDGMCTSVCTVFECPSGSTCTDLGGSELCMPDCVVPADCRDGYVCLGSVCRPPAGAGTVCTAGTDCASGECQLGYCTGPCETHEDCPNGMFCAANASDEMTCTVIPDDDVVAGTNGHSCAVNPCASGHTCIARYADDLDAYCGALCAADAECPPDMACRPPLHGGPSACHYRGYCEACTFDEQCGYANELCVAADPAVSPGASFCSTACLPGAHAAPCPEFSTCLEALFCQSTGTWVSDCAQCTGECGATVLNNFQCFPDAGTCVGDGSLCSPCRHSDQCTTGVCDSGWSMDFNTCTQPCGSAACPDGYYCKAIDGVTEPQCIPKTGSCETPGGSLAMCGYCSIENDGIYSPLGDCNNGICAAISASDPARCLAFCGGSHPACPAGSTCDTVTYWDESFDICRPDNDNWAGVTCP